MSEEKYSGIVGALRGKYINCLVTNSCTAELITEIKIFPMFTVIKITAGPYYLKSGVCYANVVKFAG